MKTKGIAIFIVLVSAHSLFSQQLPSNQENQLITNLIGMEFQLIQPGSMIVGRLEIECPIAPDTRDVEESEKWSQEDFDLCNEMAKRDSRPGFEIYIEKPFYIGKYEVTQGQWKKVMGTNPSFFQNNDTSVLQPVENVTWEDTQAFLKKLNELDPSANYRLPTEFEWEYAARAGADDLLSWAETGKQAWIQKTDKGSPQAVGKMKPNAWGLHDMLGNVWEWVEDFYNNEVFPNPTPPSSGEVHVLRGGSFISDVTNATYFFHGGGPGNGYDVGFRIVREVK